MASVPNTPLSPTPVVPLQGGPAIVDAAEFAKQIAAVPEALLQAIVAIVPGEGGEGEPSAATPGEETIDPDEIAVAPDETQIPGLLPVVEAQGAFPVALATPAPTPKPVIANIVIEGPDTAAEVPIPPPAGGKAEPDRPGKKPASKDAVDEAQPAAPENVLGVPLIAVNGPRPEVPPANDKQPRTKPATIVAPRVVPSAGAAVGEAKAPIEGPKDLPASRPEKVAVAKPDAPDMRGAIAAARREIDAAQPARKATVVLAPEPLAKPVRPGTPMASPEASLPLPTLVPTTASPAVPADPVTVEPRQTAASTLHVDRDGQWIDRLARDIAQTAGSADSIRFRLHPQTLGHLRVELSQSEHGTSVRFTAETDQARAILADAQPRLAAEAKAQGVRIAETHVDLGGSDRQAPGDSRRQDEARSSPFVRTARGAAADSATSDRPARSRSDRYA